ncbi:glucose 1-dehydrogenase [Rhizobium sp. CFBP 8762]|uniref:glucose 1-dehydrogenase n=1 Tax=Rhizobium sp. CFBP 8762 TaxID=2775279 RepID=UPI0017846A94|nr:glucose 1-dehydrogenase [Rhizobium sp. CFBP 8762]MBD8556239.1 glucose 1-dehydrogenase [Rhizobium sp. CFBP 8762]
MEATGSFKGKVVVVTGGSTGIGLSAAQQFLNEGAAAVYVTGRSEKTLNAAVHQLGERAIAVVSDVSQQADIEALKARIEKSGHKVDVLFANAGIAESNALGATSEELYDRIFDINVKGIFFTVQTLLPVLRDGGAIVLTGSIVGNKGNEGLSAYNASKAAVRSFARTFANDLKSRGIRVNTVSPGATRTPIMENGLKLDDEKIAAFDAYLKAVSPIGRMAQPEEIASAVLFLASDKAAYINGIELSVDGGLAQV